jgi:hypothetical protein
MSVPTMSVRRALPRGDVRWHCTACMTFSTVRCSPCSSNNLTLVPHSLTLLSGKVALLTKMLTAVDSDGRERCTTAAASRFSPRHSWRDDTNLDKRRCACCSPPSAPAALSWGDLIGSFRHHGYRGRGWAIIGFCGGRQDDADASISLGPSAEQGR